jgi:polyhydroxyalkanoate synthesis regulator phasin
MDKSIQKILDSILDAGTRESEAAGSKVREGFSALIRRLETPWNEVTNLKARVEALEKEVADLKSKQHSSHE